MQNYSTIAASFIFAATHARPDISFDAGRLTQGMSKPTRQHIDLAVSFIGFLNENRETKLQYSRNGGAPQAYLKRLPAVHTFVAKPPEPEEIDQHAIGLVDANFAPAYQPERRSTSGMVFFFLGQPVAWRSKLQPFAAGSTHDAELVAACLAAKEAEWLKKVTDEMLTIIHGPEQLVPRPILLYSDNLATVFTANNPTTSTRSRHLDVQYFRIRHSIRDKKIVFAHVEGKENVADFFTKPHDPTLFKHYSKLLGLIPG